METFEIAIPDEVLSDLRDRLERVRWPSEIHGSGWDYGTNPGSHGGDAADAFDVVVLSLPGYGFCSAPSAPGANVEQIAAWAHELMTVNLGFKRYGGQGGNWGGYIAGRLAFDHPETVIGLHLNLVGASPHPDRRGELSDAERAWLKQIGAWTRNESAYMEVQSTKPQSLAYGLNDRRRCRAAATSRRFEQPDLLVHDIRAFFRTLRN